MDTGSKKKLKEIDYVWDNLSLYGTVRKPTVYPELSRTCKRRVVESAMREYNSRAAGINVVNTGTASYISDGGAVIKYLTSEAGMSAEKAVDTICRISTGKNIYLFGKEICLRVKDTKDVSKELVEMLGIIEKIKKFGGR